ncbi:MAG: Lrp/AsnC family transcriptional regulator [Mycobacteriaceae bacterium]
MKTDIIFDATDIAILHELQLNGRIPVSELARKVSMSASAVKERVRRLEECGAISGYTAIVNPAILGYSILAYLRLRYPSSNYTSLHKLLDNTAEIVEAHHVTGDDCFVLKVVAVSMKHLEQVSGRVGSLGSVTTSVVYSSPLERRNLVPSQ